MQRSLNNSNEDTLFNNCVNYGPIRIYSRRTKAPTLLTGRRSKFEELHGEEFRLRELRREKNRLFSKKLKEKRENILNELLQQVNQLEEKYIHLLNRIEQLNSYKNNLSIQLEQIQELEQLKQDPLINLIKQSEITLFYQEYYHEISSSDSLISDFTDEELSFDDLFSNQSQ